MNMTWNAVMQNLNQPKNNWILRLSIDEFTEIEAATAIPNARREIHLRRIGNNQCVNCHRSTQIKMRNDERWRRTSEVAGDDRYWHRLIALNVHDVHNIVADCVTSNKLHFLASFCISVTTTERTTTTDDDDDESNKTAEKVKKSIAQSDANYGSSPWRLRSSCWASFS